MTHDPSADVTMDGDLVAPPTDPLIRERVRRTLRERLFAIAEPPVTLGRFVVLDRVGSGGMATVYAAYDPQLERKVALKVIRGAEGAARERLIREAKTMARLSHPHVATVYDAGVFDGSVVIAMEYAEAGTLRDWLHAEPRHWTDILEAFVQAARGLCAAHDAGIVHRDFKPENALVADGGRIVVADFGIARAVGGEASSAARDGEPGPSASDVAGTPRYMAPEQLVGGEIDARADQFSWSVCVFEALYGAHPFVGDTAIEIARSIVDGARRRVKPRGAAAALVPVLERGLSVAREHRHASLRELVEALRRRRRRRQIWVVAAGVAAIAAGGLAWRAVGSENDACNVSATELAGAWDSAQSARLQAAFDRTGVPYAATTFDSLRRSLDAYTREWLTMRTESCEATHVRGNQSERWLDARYRCLDARRRELAALVEVLMHPDRELVERAHDAVGKLTPVTVCADPGTETPGDPAGIAVHALDRRLDEAEAQLRTGRYRVGLEIADSVTLQARPLAHEPLLARALHLRGVLKSHAGSAKEGVEALYEASRVAARGRADWRAAEIAIELVYQVAYVQAQALLLEPLMRTAEAAVERVGNPPRLLASLHRALGSIKRQAGDLDAALKHHRSSLDAIERFGPGNEGERAIAYNSIANTQRDLGTTRPHSSSSSRRSSSSAHTSGPNTRASRTRSTTWRSCTSTGASSWKPRVGTSRHARSSNVASAPSTHTSR